MRAFYSLPSNLQQHLLTQKNTAAVPRAIVIASDDPEDKRAPTKVIPDIALAPDIKGVCKVEGTLVISSTPKKNR